MLTILTAVSSTLVEAPLGSNTFKSFDNLLNSFINIYLLISEDTATAKCLDSPLVKKVISVTTLLDSFK